jgi:ABC-2 type transport system permease protein
VNRVTQIILPLAANTVREALRQRFFNTLFLLALGLAATSWFFQQFNFGSSELKFILDFGYGALLFFGTLIAVVLPAQLWYSELDNRTVLTVMAKPIRRWEFLLGKYLGSLAIIATFTFVMALVITVITFWRESLLLPRIDPDFLTGPLVYYNEIFLFAYAQGLKFALIAAMIFLLGSFAQTQLYTVVVGFMVVLICHLQFLAIEAYGDGLEGFSGVIFALFANLLPNFHLFNIGDGLGAGPEPTIFNSLYFIILTGITLIYSVVYLALGTVAFSRREL